jgi:undecaprenyl-diphosphatase
MDLLLNILKSVLFGIVQGITEWLPISSTGHLILMEQFMPIQLFSDAASNTEFWNMYKVVIQFGSILAVLLLYWKKLNPFSKALKPQKKRQIYRTWIMILIATVPAAIIGLILNDWIDAKMSTPFVIACTLIIYGILFIWMENRQRNYAIEAVHQINAKNAFEMGMFQVLALIPGTSRSGATIFGGTMLGFSRSAAAEFSFYMSIPVMFGASLLKIIKAKMAFTAAGIIVLLVGMITAFAVSIVAIRYLMNYIRKHDFKVFGYYRIILGIIVLIFGAVGLLG